MNIVGAALHGKLRVTASDLEQEQESLIKKNPKLDKPFLKKTIKGKTEFFSPHNESYRVTNVPGQIVDQDDRLRSVGLWIGIGGGWEWRLPADMSMSFGLRYDVPMSQLYMGDMHAPGFTVCNLPVT